MLRSRQDKLCSSDEAVALIRDGETMKIPYLLVVGQREADQGAVALRLRHRRDEGVQPLDDVVRRIADAVSSRSLEP